MQKHIFVCTTILSFYQIDEIVRINNIPKENVIIFNPKKFRLNYHTGIKDKYLFIEPQDDYPSGKINRLFFLKKSYSLLVKSTQITNQDIFYLQNLDNYLCNWIASKHDFCHLEDGMLNIYGYSRNYISFFSRCIKFCLSIFALQKFNPFFLFQKGFSRPLYATFPYRLLNNDKHLYSQAIELYDWLNIYKSNSNLLQKNAYIIIGQETATSDKEMYFIDMLNLIDKIRIFDENSIIYYCPHPFYKEREHLFFKNKYYDILVNIDYPSEIYISENNILNVISIFSTVSLHMSLTGNYNIYHYNTQKYYGSDAENIMKKINSIDINSLSDTTKK
ncbi:TPA: hypothetical protein NHT78_000657 [Morganella morganii]|nr:hypothetical protein [Morganella morganii]